MTDLRLMTRILRNLLSNACRYSTQGGILLAARRRGERLSLEVWDTGRGIAADCLESIFLEFNQLDVGRAADRKGVGLRSEEHTSELQSLMRISYAVFGEKTKKQNKQK